jgi:glycerophosphoryl diester phosphodiesterase
VDASDATFPHVIAHRGASFDAPENTTAAFDRALEQGADGLELDVHQTRDGHLIVWHDDSLDRTARLAGAVRGGVLAEVKFDEIALCDAGSWFNESFPERAMSEYVGLCPLTLEDVLLRYGDRIDLYIELKNVERSPGMIANVLDLLERHRGGRHHRILSTDPLSLLKIHTEDPAASLIQLLPHRGSWTLDLRDVARYAVALAPLYTMVGHRLVADARSVGLSVCPYTVNDPHTATELAEAGVDALITDVPADMARILTPPQRRRGSASLSPA